MADDRNFPAPQAGDKLRRILARRRRQRSFFAIAALATTTAAPLAASLHWKPPLLLVWNASSSAQVGLYRVQGDEPARRGDMVVARTSGPSRTLAARRRYLPANVPLVKRVAAIAGDRVCALREVISVNGKYAGSRRRVDVAGRPMPWWSGCRRLGSREYFLMMDSPLSFDGRYFGITRGEDLLGRAELLWAKPAKVSNDG